MYENFNALGHLTHLHTQSEKIAIQSEIHEKCLLKIFSQPRCTIEFEITDYMLILLNIFGYVSHVHPHFNCHPNSIFVQFKICFRIPFPMDEGQKIVGVRLLFIMKNVLNISAIVVSAGYAILRLFLSLSHFHFIIFDILFNRISSTFKKNYDRNYWIMRNNISVRLSRLCCPDVRIVLIRSDKFSAFYVVSSD